MPLFKRLFGCFKKPSQSTRARALTDIKANLKALNDEVPLFSLEGYQTWAKVVSVYDVDTVTLIIPLFEKFFKFRCRLSEIDGAERRSDDPLEREYALKSRERLIELIGEESLVFIKCNKFDKYGRLLAEIFQSNLDSKSINQILLDEHLAYQYKGGTKKPFKEWINLTNL